MISPTASTSPVQPVTEAKTPAVQQKPKSAPQPAAGDSVQLSHAAHARLAARQEFTETAAQTTKEANRGDRQAQKLLAKEAAKSKVA